MQIGRDIKLLATVLAVFCVSAQAALATEVVINTGKDNTLYENSTGSLSNGEGAHFFVGRTGQGVNSIRRGLIVFDIVGNIPAGSTINSVELTLNMSRTPVITQRTIELRLVTADWGEGPSNDVGGEGSGTAALAGDATWLHTFFDTDFWTIPGGDFSDTVSGSQEVGALGFYTWSSTAEMVADVQAWLDAPAGNFGWLLLGDETVTRTAKRFDSLQNTVSNNRPILTVDFTPGPPTGACCNDVAGACTDGRTQADCESDGFRYGGDDSDCSAIDPPCIAPPPDVPTVSVWGVMAMALSLAAVATILLKRRNRIRA